MTQLRASSPELYKLSDLIVEKLALPLPAALQRRAFALHQLDNLWNEASTLTGTVFDRLLKALDVECVHDEDDVRLIPRTGPAIVVANHPHGFLDGILLGSLLRRIRPDVKIVSNSMLIFLPDLAKEFVAINLFRTPTTTAENAKALRQAIRWLEGGSLLLAFPAGDVSRFDCRRVSVADRPWSPHFVDLAKRVSAKMIPLFISGSNSTLFHAMSVVNNELGSAMLARELMKKRGSRVSVRVGHAIPAEVLSRFETRREAIEYVRLRTYLLSNGNRQPGAAAISGQIEGVLDAVLPLSGSTTHAAGNSGPREP